MKYKALIVFTLLILVLCSVRVMAEQGCEHQYGEWVLTQAPTCAAKGEVSRTCTLCGDVQTASVAESAHTEGDWTLAKAPEVGGAGSMQKACTVCGEVLLTQALAALPEPETAPEETMPEETTQEPTEDEDGGWIEITIPVAIGICLAPNLVLVIILLIRKIRRAIASKRNDVNN